MQRCTWECWIGQSWRKRRIKTGSITNSYITSVVREAGSPLSGCIMPTTFVFRRFMSICIAVITAVKCWIPLLPVRNGWWSIRPTLIWSWITVQEKDSRNGHGAMLYLWHLPYMSSCTLWPGIKNIWSSPTKSLKIPIIICMIGTNSCFTGIGVISPKKKKTVKRFSGDVEMAGY